MYQAKDQMEAKNQEEKEKQEEQKAATIKIDDRSVSLCKKCFNNHTLIN